jgi:hypothetical protein
MVRFMACKLDELLRNHAVLVGAVSELAQLSAHEILGQSFTSSCGRSGINLSKSRVSLMPWSSLKVVCQLNKT